MTWLPRPPSIRHTALQWHAQPAPARATTRARRALRDARQDDLDERRVLPDTRRWRLPVVRRPAFSWRRRRPVAFSGDWIWSAIGDRENLARGLSDLTGGSDLYYIAGPDTLEAVPVRRGMFPGTQAGGIR